MKNLLRSILHCPWTLSASLRLLICPGQRKWSHDSDGKVNDSYGISYFSFLGLAVHACHQDLYPNLFGHDLRPLRWGDWSHAGTDPSSLEGHLLKDSSLAFLLPSGWALAILWSYIFRCTELIRQMVNSYLVLWNNIHYIWLWSWICTTDDCCK